MALFDWPSEKKRIFKCSEIRFIEEKFIFEEKITPLRETIVFSKTILFQMRLFLCLLSLGWASLVNNRVSRVLDAQTQLLRTAISGKYW